MIAGSQPILIRDRPHATWSPRARPHLACPGPDDLAVRQITGLCKRGIPRTPCHTRYDAAGNRTSLTRSNGAASLLPSAVTSASYDAANEQVAFAGGTLTYDANGNLTSDGVNTYQWDARNRLIGISGGSTATFNYDVLGRRTSKAVGSLTSQFLYDGNDIAAEIGGGAVGANYLRSLTIDEPFIRQTGTGNEFYHTDALGSALALSTGQGTPATTYGYEPFGKTTVTGTSSNAFQYTGRENDGTGLAYYRARYYDDSHQRFISEDPIGFAGGDVNRYAYVGNGPTNWVDPHGLRVYLSSHVAGGDWVGGQYTPPAHHLSLVLIPDNPAAFPGWPSFPGNNVGPRPSQTLGAHPTLGLNGLTLTSTPNYPDDQLHKGQHVQIVPTPSGMNDTEFIQRLVRASNCFQGVPYSSPDNFLGMWSSGTYNSNSFVSGIIMAAGGTPPPIQTRGQFQVPGYTAPVPASAFDKSCGRQ